MNKAAISNTFKSTLFRILLSVGVCFGGVGFVRAKSPAPLSGHFIYKRAGRFAAVIEVTVEHQPGGKFTVAVLAAHPNAHGAAPEGGGEGKVGPGGVLRFPFEDSFSNRGTGTFRRTGAGRYRLVIDITDVQDSRCLTFYGDLTLRRSHH